MAGRLRDSVRGGDLVARLGGDEFGVLIRGDVADPGVTGRRILDAIRHPFTVDGHDATVSASVGAVVATGPGLDADRLLRYADDAMYTGKQHGKGALILTQPEDPGTAPR